MRSLALFLTLPAFALSQAAASIPWSNGTANASVADAAGNLYVAGTSGSPWPEMKSLGSARGHNAAFVLKISSEGKSLWVTAVADLSAARAIAVDADGNVYLVGSSQYSRFPTVDGEYLERQHVWVAKLNPEGDKLLWGVSIPNIGDWELKIVLDGERNVYLAGPASGNAFRPSPGTLDLPTPQGWSPSRSFVLKLRSDGESMEFQSLITRHTNVVTNLAVAADGTMYFAGVGRAADGDVFLRGEPLPYLQQRISSDGGESWSVFDVEPLERYAEFVVHPTQPDVLFSPGLNATLLRSDDGGVSWATHAEGFGQPITNLVIHPLNPERMWGMVFGSRDPVRRSDDGGKTWTALKCECSPLHIAVDPNDPERVYVGTNYAFLHSDDAGMTWQQTLPEFALINAVRAWPRIVVDPHDSSRIYSALGGGVGVSEDRGATWRRVTERGAGLASGLELAIDPNDSSVLYAFGTVTSYNPYSEWRGVIRSADRGATWERISPDFCSAGRLAAVNDSGTVLYASTSCGLWKSIDGGTTWTQPGDEYLRFPASWFAVSPSHPKRLYFPSGRGSDVFVSSVSAGASEIQWIRWFGGFGHESATRIAVDASGQIYLAGATSSTNLLASGMAGREDVLVASISPDGSELRYLDGFGGRRPEAATTMAVRPDGTIAVGGYTDSDDFPSDSPWHGVEGGRMGFFAVFDGSGQRLWSRYLSAAPLAIFTDGSGNFRVAGFALDGQLQVSVAEPPSDPL